MNYEANIFRIENSNQLSANYRTFEIRGLSEENSEYDANKQYIIERLSYQLSHPITVIKQNTDEGSKDYLVIRDEEEIARQIPFEFEVKQGDTVIFKPTGQVLYVNFENCDESNGEVCRRFLQFAVNDSFAKIHSLWSPGAGKPFFFKTPIISEKGINVYSGFNPRVVELPNGGWGINFDITTKFVSSTPLSKYITKNEFNKLKKNHFVYHYGEKWYEVKFDEYGQLNASQQKFVRKSDSKKLSVIEDLREHFQGRNMPPEIASLPDDVALLIYRNNKKEPRHVPAALCYQVLDTDEIGTLQNKAIISPFYRRKKQWTIRRNFLDKLKFGETVLKISQKPLAFPIQKFLYPDQEFGNGTILSVRDTPKAIKVSVDSIGEKRKQLLKEKGCYVTEIFEPQYFLMPESIAYSFGSTLFFNDLTKRVNQMHPIKEGWKPQVIPYDDRNYRGLNELAVEIMGKVGNNITMGGYTIIMIPQVAGKEKEYDQLAAILVSQCAEKSIFASIMHTHTLSKCIEYNPEKGFIVKNTGLYHGYLSGVALNQVLLNNERWPFILATPLHADLTIGIDVKKNVAGYVFVDKFGKYIKPYRHKSKNKERLSSETVCKVFIDNIKILSESSTIRQIVVHRDGRLFASESLGIQNAIEHLKEKGSLPEDVNLTVVEIPKNSTISLRLFEVTKQYDVLTEKQDNWGVKNPQIGSWARLNDNEGFVCTTGREFEHRGSAKPLYVKKAYGSMPLKELLEDVFYLSTLAFTKPDDCSRNPITIKMADRLINDYGEHYNEEEYERIKTLNEE